MALVIENAGEPGTTSVSAPQFRTYPVIIKWSILSVYQTTQHKARPDNKTSRASGPDPLAKTAFPGPRMATGTAKKENGCSTLKLQVGENAFRLQS